jgi:hypothetical protein
MSISDLGVLFPKRRRQCKISQRYNQLRARVQRPELVHEAAFSITISIDTRIQPIS